MPASPSTLRVLVVDDNADSAEMLQVLLGMMGHDAHLAHDGRTALEQYDTLKPQVVLLDISLPDVSGYEVAKQLRAQQAGPLLLIALTGWTDPEARQKALESGFDHHVTKPADIDVLNRLLSEAAV
jgi:CheY-like chemotaxis protein